MGAADDLGTRPRQGQRHRYGSEISLTPIPKHTPKNDSEVAEVIGEQIEARRTEPRLVTAVEKFKCRHNCIDGIQGALSSDGFACNRESALHPERELGF